MAIQDRLSDREQEAFHSMLTQLRTGRKKVLSSNQREWVERIWMDFQLDAGEVQNLWSSGKVKASLEPSEKMEFEKMPKPLRPPGRKS